VIACGLDEGPIPARLDLGTGKVDERALLASKRRRVLVSEQRRLSDLIIAVPAGTQVRRTIGIDWTLTFRRLG
jgi:hypothetical protein